MNSVKKLMMKTLLVVMLCFSVNIVPHLTTSMKAEAAAIIAPMAEDTKITLYAGYKTYTIDLQNVARNAAVIYKSSNAKIASVTSKGKVTPIKEGSATIHITVKQNNKTYYLKVLVNIKNPSVDFTKSTNYMNINDSFLFKAEAAGMDGKVVWSISDTSIATINPSGLVTAVAKGSVVVNANVGEKTASINLDIGSNLLGTFSKNITCYDDTTTWITVTNYIKGEQLRARVADEDIVDCSMGEWEGNRKPLTIKPIKPGKTTITISSNTTNDKLILSITVIKKPKQPEVLSSSDVYAKCGNSTVEIVATNKYDEALGSGFFIADGMVVTNYHVIEGCNSISVKTIDKKEYKVQNILGYDKTLDLAILEVKAKMPSLSVSQEPALIGQDIYTIGSPFGLTGTMSKGMISTASRIIDNVDYIQIDASISPGNSGGPLVNSYGEVIGINTMYLEDGQNLNFAINIKELQKINTNWPISVADYYTKYEVDFEKEFYDNMIKEDPEVSQYTDTCQEIPSGVGVQGTIKATENGDCYYFKITEPGWFYAISRSNDLQDMKNTYVELYSYAGDKLATCSEYEGELYQDIEYYINTPGDYILFISLPDGYSGEDVDYMFVMFYE